ncbi:MAG: NTP transferase domain-containing protein [Firmicutes bacterium]|nr:NTP transferase domain-containing protein [Bacillota bacterium]
MDAVVLAGARNDGRLKDVDSAIYEALIDICGKSMVSYVVDALLKSKEIGRVVLVGPRHELETALIRDIQGFLDLIDKKVMLVESGDSLFGNIGKGINALATQDPVLLITSDLPLITPDAIDDFISRCRSRGTAQVFYSIITKETNEARFPGMKRTYQKLKEGILTGGNLAIIHPAALIQARKLIEMGIASRKKPWLMAAVLGPKCIFRFIFGILRVQDVEERFRKITGLTGYGVFSPYAEIAVDVDKPGHLELVRSHLTQSSGRLGDNRSGIGNTSARKGA